MAPQGKGDGAMSGEVIDERQPTPVEIETLKSASEAQWSKLDAMRERLDEHDLRMERTDALLKGAGGNGHPSWSERLILLEDWQRRQEKLLTALPTHLAEIKIQLQMLVSQRETQASARTGAFWMAVASLVVAVLVGMGSAALMWWSSRP
jgi:hypothetical protein